MENNYYQISCDINELFADTIVTYSYSNNNPENENITLNVPLQTGVKIIDIEIIKDAQKILSNIVLNSNQKEYVSVDNNNNNVVTIFDEAEHKFVIKLGQLEPKKSISFKLRLSQQTYINNNNYVFSLINLLPTFENSLTSFPYIKCDLKFNTKSELTYIEKVDTSKLLSCTQKDNTINFELNDKSVKYLSYDSFSGDTCKYFIFNIRFKTKNSSNNLTLYKQYNDKLDETTYYLNYSKNNNNILPQSKGLFIFLVDQSGSMSGRPIKLVKEALKVLLHSLSYGSFFQIVGFGFNYRLYNEQPIKFNQQNLHSTLELIDTINGDMGGTELYDPLNYIFNYYHNSNIKLPKHLFILTDGYLNTRKPQTLDLIYQNRHQFYVHASGLGTDFDHDLIVKSALFTNGTYNFIYNIENINQLLNQQLAKCFLNFVSNINLALEDEHVLYKYNAYDILVNQLPQYYSFVVKGNHKGDLNFRLTYGDNENSIVTEYLYFKSSDVNSIENGNILSVFLFENIINHNELGLKEIQNLTIKYNILNKYSTIFLQNENSSAEQITYVQNHLNNKAASKPKLVNKTISHFKDYSINKIDDNKKNEDLKLNPEDIKPKKRHSFFSFNPIEKISNLFSKNNNTNKHNIVLEQFDFYKMLFTQDIVYGFWIPNSQTENVIMKYQNYFDNVLKVVNNNEQIATTFIVIYYIKHEQSNKMQEIPLIVNKALDYLNDNDFSYLKIIQHLGL